MYHGFESRFLHFSVVCKLFLYIFHFSTFSQNKSEYTTPSYYFEF